MKKPRTNHRGFWLNPRVHVTGKNIWPVRQLMHEIVRAVQRMTPEELERLRDKQQ